ncbi:MAG TPA: DNA ligase [Xanthobacteraceae bacterium]|nr:DNA ligase [Xanthobacteraceae bacterium]
MRSRILPAGFVAPCLPIANPIPPAGPGWFHEVKHDGFRLLVLRDRERVRLFTRRGHDWAERFPAVVAAALALRASAFLIDAEVVCAGADGVADFDRLRRRRHGPEAFAWAFDLLMLGGEDLRGATLSARKLALEGLLRKAPAAIAMNEHHEGDGPALFAAACAKGLEGIVSKRATSRYRSGRCDDWRKAKNPSSPAARREALEDWSR